MAWHPVGSAVAHPIHAIVGGAIGTVLIPIPIVGTLVGAALGGYWGHKFKGGWFSKDD